MNKDPRKVYVGAYGICIVSDEVLVIKKARGPYTGLYDLPGGGLQFDETVEACLRREMVEETGSTTIQEMKLLGINEYQCQYTNEDGVHKDFHHLGIYYVVRATIDDLKVVPDGEDSSGACFIPVSELSSENTSPIALPMIIKAKDFSFPAAPSSL